ncbi:MAG TPA: glucan biosynthesis protein [Gammaproteobacteria bacterium]|nr:glucan biosynthesis protein [Gammaproteobacteria bacterium]
MSSVTAARSGALGVAVAVLAATSTTDAQERPAATFNRAILVAKAEELAKQDYVAPPSSTDSANRLSYDQYRAIRFQKGASIWARQNRTFTLDLFHPGFIFDTPVNINLVVGGVGTRVLFKNDLFEFGPEVGTPPAHEEEESGYSGFRVRAPINRPDYSDEFLVFQGASYFRAIARDQVYGLSARGLAIRTARAEGEEFPVFTDFWIERPAERATEIVIHALLQSPSVVGAYTFTTKPGAETVMDVVATLFPRRQIKNFGMAPLTSMFLFDSSGGRNRFDDFRSAVHDSDGLEMLTGRGERVWRPLANPRTLQVSGFIDRDPRGFGLVQRKRRFDDYQDAESRFEKRPSLWVEPRGNWGEGHVELVEIPTDREIHDNIVAYWQSATPLPPGQATEFAYRLRWLAEPLDTALARVVATRSGVSATNADQREFVVDFRGASPPPADLVISIASSAGKVLAPRGSVVADTGALRVSFELAPERADVVELRLVLTSKNQPWGETWLYRWSR